MDNATLCAAFEDVLDDDVLALRHICLEIEHLKDFDLNSVEDERCVVEFRFDRADIESLAEELQLPGELVCDNGIRVGRIEALCILLRRLAYPNRLCDLQPLFRRSLGDLSYIVNVTVKEIHDRHQRLLTDLYQPWLNHGRIREFAAAIRDAGSPLANCWGFIDGTLRPMCRPSADQRMVFNGQKRVHGLKFQSVMVPNGLIANLYGPVEGKRHDSGEL